MVERSDTTGSYVAPVFRTPAGAQARRAPRSKNACDSWHPYRGAPYRAPQSVVSACGLNHRLIAVIPPGFSGIRAKTGLRVVRFELCVMMWLRACEELEFAPGNKGQSPWQSRMLEGLSPSRCGTITRPAPLASTKSRPREHATVGVDSTGESTG